MKNGNKGEKTFRTCLIILFVIYITLYISQASGYYDYKLHRRTELTNEQIREFENDVKAGKPVDVEKYLKIDPKDYNNKFSSSGKSFSNFTSKYIKIGIENAFKILEQLLGD
jgi:hypothetical protein